MIAKAEELAQAGIAVRTVTLIITDGGDYGSTRCKPADVAALVTDMLAQENHIVAAMGISDGTTDFKKVFRAMGIPDRWILTPGNSASEIRRAFQVFSQSAVRARRALPSSAGSPTSQLLPVRFGDTGQMRAFIVLAMLAGSAHAEDRGFTWGAFAGPGVRLRDGISHRLRSRIGPTDRATSSGRSHRA